jgi:malate dehydrogenase (oxaloacetate-decarboxylating)
MSTMTESEPAVARLPHGADLLSRPLLNKDAAFTQQEREALGLRGLLPWRCATIGQQVALELEHLRSKSSDLEKYIGLAGLADRNETLFYRLLVDHLEELAPIVYTPTVGEACRRFSHILRRPRGLWITPDDIGCVPELLRNAGRSGIRLIVATDNERILGLGDQGAGGMGIPVGKLELYSAGAGIDPSLTLPVSLDCGTDNEALLADPLYLGYPRPRLRGPAYDRYIEAFVSGVSEVFPGAVLQWEDFKQHNAMRLLDRYRQRIPSFNDDIQGTAAVVLAGIMAALAHRGARLREQRLVLVGAGAAGIGIARAVRAQLRSEGAPDGQVRHAIVLVDSRGLIFEGRDQVADDKMPFALPAAEMARYGFEPARGYDLETVIKAVGPTVLIGTSGVQGVFSQAVISEMAARVAVPIVMPLSNPTANAEATPRDIFQWSRGRALVATGSPFEPVRAGMETRLVGQANNVFIFPGVGLAAIVANVREITDEMFGAAAAALAGMVGHDRLARGALYPPIAELRDCSRAVAVAVARQACESGLAQIEPGTDIEAAISAAMWVPRYQELRKYDNER